MRKNRIEYYYDDEAADHEQRPFHIPWFVRAIEFFLPVVAYVHARIVRAAWLFVGVFWWLFDRVAWLLSIVLRPIRWGIDSLLMHTLFSERTEKISAIRFGVLPRISAAWAFGMSKIAFWSEQSMIVGWLFMPLRLLLIAFVSVCDFLVNWLFTRNYRQLLFAIPAAVFMVPLTISIVMIPLKSSQSIASHYQLAAHEAIANHELEAAKLYFRKISQLRGGEGLAWNLAGVAEQTGEYQEAYQHMLKLASLEKPGLPSAHLWIANAIANKRIDPHVEDPVELIKTHLNHVLAVEPKNEVALRMLANVYLNQGESEKSIETLEKSNPTNRQRQLSKQINLGIANYQVGKVRLGLHLIAKADEEFGEMYRSSTVLQPSSFVVWSSAKEMMGDLLRAIEIIQIGMEQYPENETLVTANRWLSLRYIHSLETQSKLGAKPMALVSKLFELEPENNEVLIQIAKMSAETDLKEQTLKLLQPLIDADRLSVAVYDQLAVSAMIRGDMQAARKLYRIVISRTETLPVALNNLAWLLAHEDPVDLDEALELVDKALVILPKNPSIRATRGHILVKQGRWVEAIKELEFALNGLPDNRKAHMALSLAYSRIGKSELADRHQRLIDRSE